MSLRFPLLRRLRRDERGTTLVEFAFVLALFLLMFFALLDFGRLAYNWVMAEKSMQMAARMAAVRPAICTGVPQRNLAGSGNNALFGTSCDFDRTVNGQRVVAVCAGESMRTYSCSGSTTNATANDIFTTVAPLLSGTDVNTGQPASAANLLFTYTYDPAMNFLGGPYVPVVTVEIQNLRFDFTSPLLGLARLAGAAGGGTNDTYDPLTFPPMSVSLPGEDLALGNAG